MTLFKSRASKTLGSDQPDFNTLSNEQLSKRQTELSARAERLSNGGTASGFLGGLGLATAISMFSAGGPVGMVAGVLLLGITGVMTYAMANAHTAGAQNSQQLMKTTTEIGRREGLNAAQPTPSKM
jgi:hypothetical protein